ncbi:hypothetical protein H2248_011356 [Termitomyces sp. 'cryptogamus']|nr:hypothetical protein H2248_011356 [Termitomyces sp. 'cryptogamus']
MKFALAFVSALIVISQTSALVLSRDNTTTNAEDEASAVAAACSDPRSTLPLWRAWRGASTDHFYTLNADEMQNAVTRFGYQGQGITGYLFTVSQTGNVPLYRLYHPGMQDHFYTTSAPERDNAIRFSGYTYEGIAGFCYPDASCGGRPLYRSWNPSASDHFYTMSEAEKNNAQAGGWSYEGVACYVYPY